MMNKLYVSIASGLRLIKDCPVYLEAVPQKFMVPSWMILFYDQNPARGINGCINNRIRVDVAYFPEDDTAVNTECWEVGQVLIRDFRMENFKIKNRNLKITDSVLHFLFDVDYREYLPNNASTMQTMSQNAEMKED